VVKNVRLRRREVVGFFARLEPCTVVLEACGGAYHWGREIEALGHRVKLVPPPFLKRYRGVHKNDARDAHALTLAGGDPLLRPVALKSREDQARALGLKVRALLVRQHTQAANSLRGLLAEFGLAGRCGAKGLEELIDKIESGEVELPRAAVEALAVLIRQWQALGAEIARMSGALLQEAKSDERTVRLMTVPGVGPLTALAVVAKVGDARRFRCGRHFAAWLGLAPRQHASGQTRRLGSITKAGDEDVRSLLVMGAAAVLIRARRCPAHADPWVVAIAKRKPFKVAAVALAARMARIVWALLSHSGVYLPPAARRSPRPAS
jgi:transposase